MTGPSRIAGGGEPLHFTFAGKRMEGRAGDSIASALLANGIVSVGRSFKYRRPRGIMAAGEDEPNAIVDVVLNGVRVPNVRATTQALEPGMQIAPVLGRGAALLTGLLSPFIASGFYYKTFLWPKWGLFEPMIRRMAGLGRVDPDSRMAAGPGGNLAVDLCVVGGGWSGLLAATQAAESGQRVLLVERREALGGSSLWRDGGDFGAASVDPSDRKAGGGTGAVLWRGLSGRSGLAGKLAGSADHPGNVGDAGGLGSCRGGADGADPCGAIAGAGGVRGEPALRGRL